MRIFYILYIGGCIAKVFSFMNNMNSINNNINNIVYKTSFVSSSRRFTGLASKCKGFIYLYILDFDS